MSGHRLLLGAVALSLVSCGGEPQVDVPPPICVPTAQMSLGSIHLGDTRDQVLARLGQPATRTTGVGEDDGGQYTAETLTYGDLSVVIVRGVVDVVSSATPEVGTPGGLRPGIVLSVAEHILGIPLIAPDTASTPISVGQCMGGGEMEGDEYGMTLTIGAASIIRSVELWTNRP